MNGFRTPQRKDFYIKYKKSNIFADEDLLLDKSQNVTLKVNKGKCAYSFKPVFEDELNARERYLKQYWEIDCKKVKPCEQLSKTLDEKAIKELVDDYHQSKVSNGRDSKKYSARRQYIKEFFTNHIFDESFADTKGNSLKLNRSKSFFQPRTKSSIVLEGDSDNMGQAQFSKIESLTSNIFNVKEKEKIQLRIDTNNSTTKPIREIVTPQVESQVKAEKAKIPSVLDWRYSNTELGTKSHLIRSKTIDPFLRKQEDLISHFDEDEKKHSMLKSRNRIDNGNKEMFLPIYATKSIDTRPNRNLVHRMPDDKEIELYEMTIREHFITVDCKKIKRLFLVNGIHMYDFEEDGSAVDGFQAGKISFRIRKDKNDQEIAQKMDMIKEEIGSLGLKMQKIVKETHLKKERRPTPGTELLKKGKKPIVLAKE